MATKPLDPCNIQGDILAGLPKKSEAFFFFSILDDKVSAFKSRLEQVIPLVTTVKQVQKDREEIAKYKRGEREDDESGLVRCPGVNVAFSNKGVLKLSIVGDIGDQKFVDGMKKDAQILGDKGVSQNGVFEPEWDEAFKGDIDGVLLVTGECRDTVKGRLNEVKELFGASIEEVTTIFGDVRPGKEAGHEHFGYKDGISHPSIAFEGSDPALPGQAPVQQGVVLLGRDGDERKNERPEWAIDGSILAFRKLPQLVPEFDDFLLRNAQPVGDPTVNVVDLLGARFVGRWKSGAPIVKSQLKDNIDLGNDKKLNNDFRFDPSSQEACPFAAHIRKMNPRDDIPQGSIDPHLILRRGIPYGPEVTPEEKAAKVTLQDRGLLFACYQSDLSKGFSFLQQLWANPDGFPPGKTQVPGPDAIIGQSQDNKNGPRTITGAFIGNTGENVELDQQWVLSKGGEYFFSPSLDALRRFFAGDASA